MRRLLYGAAVAFGLVFGQSASAGVLVVGASDDRNAADNNNDGLADFLGDQGDGFLRVFGTGGGGEIWRAALEFNISGVTAGSTVSSANLFLADRGTQIAGAIIDVYGYAGDGTIQLADFAAPTLLASFTVSGNNDNHNINLTSFIQSRIANGDTYAGIVLRSRDEGPGNFSGADIASSEWFNPGERPTLTVNYEASAVPEPASMSLLAIGAVGMGGYRLRRRLKAEPAATV